MSYPIVQFVDAPSPTATVRFDFNETNATSVSGITKGGFSPGSPSLEGDPDGVGVEYSDRIVEVSMRIIGGKAAALARQSALAREILRPRNWLHFTLNAFTKPIWFRTYRGQPQDISLDGVYVVRKDGSEHQRTDRWQIGVSLAAEPFAYGERVTLPAVTINNDPAHATNPCRYALPAILGDAPTPVMVDLTPSRNWTGGRPLMAIVAHEAAVAPAPIVWQTGAFTAGTDTTASTSDAAFSGGTRSTVTFATNTGLVTRLSGIAPVSPPSGRYKVLCRMARSDTSTTWAARLGQNYGLSQVKWGETVIMDRVASSAAGYATYLDLGVFSFPMGGGEWTADEVGVLPEAPVELQIQRLSGAGSVYPDVFVLIPLESKAIASARTLISHFVNSEIGEVRSGVWDADREAFRAMNFGLSLQTGVIPNMQGQFVQAVPGASNVLHVHHQVDTAPSAIPGTWYDDRDVVSASVSAVLSYHPRWLYIGDGS